ncbi:hypothetical protein AG1IA_02160 [Rhizoctonia solani AG-1 IA]|uniref:Uncharacterized protein n=1 Tax=Thanatephorus cucumeris (strain AG1-IA) TaxID=983506 RepID=L8X484_THACA|nr:hypothetical protein AG1IA_02160 [Rhizoctonia solani AG-1 IA]
MGWNHDPPPPYSIRWGSRASNQGGLRLTRQMLSLSRVLLTLTMSDNFDCRRHPQVRGWYMSDNLRSVARRLDMYLHKNKIFSFVRATLGCLIPHVLYNQRGPKTRRNNKGPIPLFLTGMFFVSLAGSTFVSPEVAPLSPLRHFKQYCTLARRMIRSPEKCVHLAVCDRRDVGHSLPAGSQRQRQCFCQCQGGVVLMDIARHSGAGLGVEINRSWWVDTLHERSKVNGHRWGYRGAVAGMYNEVKKVVQLFDPSKFMSSEVMPKQELDVFIHGPALSLIAPLPRDTFGSVYTNDLVFALLENPQNWRDEVSALNLRRGKHIGRVPSSGTSSTSSLIVTSVMATACARVVSARCDVKQITLFRHTHPEIFLA